ncbi:MAG: hypothetical protein HZA88_17675 [Verrucomicrobia bacterium]|nr:hypothetical protein [Verrucomicrobiota bacterium]
MNLPRIVLSLVFLTLTHVGAASPLDGTGDLFSGWTRFTANSPASVILINTQNADELRAQIKQAGGGNVLRRPLRAEDNADGLPHGLRKVLQLRNRIEELSGLPCVLVNYMQITRRDLEKPNIKAIVMTAWKARDDKVHDQELAELIKLTTKPFIAFCGGHHMIYMTYGGKNGVMRKLKPGEADANPKYFPGYYKEWNFMPVRIVKRDPLFDGLPDEIIVPQRHYAECKQLPAEFDLLASSAECKVQVIKHRDRPVYGTQFHPEIYDDEHPHGKLLLQNFFRIAGVGSSHSSSEWSIADRIGPVAKGTGFAMDGYFVWCGSVIKVGDQYHMFASRWPVATKFPEGYRQNSEIVRAVASRPEGPYKFQQVVIGKRAPGHWDSGMAHNPAIYKVGDTFVLYYNASDVGSRYRQIGIATAPSVTGPWTRRDKPLDLGLAADANNPAACFEPDGSVRLFWRAVNLRVFISVACSFEGPYTLANDGVWPAARLEDFFFFKHAGAYHVICEDNAGSVTGHERWGAHLCSADGVGGWRPTPQPAAYDHTIRWTDGTEFKPVRRERPWFLIEDGKVTHLFTAVYDGVRTWNQPVPLKPPLALASSPATPWKPLRDDGAYQNGGYWATPLPWLMKTFMNADPARAAAAFCDAVEDFQARKDINEWVNDNAPKKRGVRDYCASVAMPLAGAKQLRAALAASGKQLPPELAKKFDTAEKWLRDQAKRVLRGSSRTGKDGVRIFTPDATGGYGAFWVRDWSYMIEGCPEAFTREEIRDGYLFLAAAQREDGCMPDRVRADGKGVYSPGGEAKPFSKNGSVDQSPFMVILCHQYWKLHGDLDPFRRTADALEKAMRFTPRNPANGLVTISDATLFRPYSFLDTVPLVGDQQFDSVLFWDACRKLAEMFVAAGQRDRGALWQGESERVKKSLATLWDEKPGVFVAASEKWRQPSVWGSLFAVHAGLATPEQSDRIMRWCFDNYHLIVWRGQIRHLPKGTFWGRPEPEFVEKKPGEGQSAGRIVEEIEQRVGGLRTMRFAKPADIKEFSSLVTVGTWSEIQPGAHGGEQTNTVTGEIWTAAIQAALDKHRGVFLPARDKPYYLDGPVVLRSGCRFAADPRTEIRLKPGTSTCMIRNENVVGGQDGLVAATTPPDSDIVVEGGIWTTLATSRRQSNGNARARSAKQNDVPGCHGVILLSNVRRVQVRNVTIRQSRAFGIHLSNCAEFVVDGVSFEDHGRDGVHVNGPASYGIIREIRGVTHDDFVALNAWDWRNCAPTFGPIHHMLVEQIHGNARPTVHVDSGAFPDGTAEIRLLPGTKLFPGGAKLACDISDCVFLDLHDIRTVKLYDQPNLELGRDKDFADPIGDARNLFFSRMVFNRPGRIQVGANVDGLVIEDVQCNFDIAPPGKPRFALVEVGPMSETYKRKPGDPKSWVEIFSPDKDVTVRHLHLSNVRALVAGKRAILAKGEDQMMRVSSQTLNPDYPKTTPRGGTGKGTWIK